MALNVSGKLARLLVAPLCVAALVVCTKHESSVEHSTSTAASSTADSSSTTTTQASTPTPAATPAPRDACAMVSAEELKSTTGIEGEGRSSTSGGAAVCSWFGATGKAAIVQVYPYASSYEGSREAFEDLYKTKSVELPGVGDKAFIMYGKTGPMATLSLSATKGQSAISVQIMGNPDEAASRKEAIALANVILGKL